MTMNDYDSLDEFDDADPPEESNNRTFLFVAGGLGVLVLLAFVCLVGYFFISRGSSAQTSEATAQAQVTEQAMTIQAGLTQNADSQAQTQAAGATATLPPTNTPVIAEATATPSETPNPATATVGAAFTQIAVSTQTVVAVGTSTALPNTGFADDVGLPGMFALALAFVLVIFFVRRLRATPVR